jgi:hypothetical protein
VSTTTVRIIGSILLVITAGCITATAQEDEREPEPYHPEEFSEWALALRRGEIVAFGSFPITLLATRLLYGLGRFVAKSIQAGEIDARYAPLFFAAPGAPDPSRGEQIVVLSVSFSLSVGVAVADFLLGRREDSDAVRLR